MKNHNENLPGLENPLIDKEGTVDLDRLAETLSKLEAEITSYRESLSRYIAARRELLGKNAPSGDLQDNDIPRLLEQKEELDREFREQFKVDPLPQGPTAADVRRAAEFRAGG